MYLTLDVDRNQIILASTLVILGIFSALTISTVDYNMSDQSEQQEELESDYASPGEDSAVVDREVDEDAVVVEIQTSLSPSRPVVDIGDPVVFENQNNFPIRIEFDRTEEEPVIEPNEATQMRFNAVNYYDVYNNDNDERLTGGSISVDF